MDPSPFSIAGSSLDGRTTLTVRGELDLATAPELEAAVRAGLDDGDVVLDLRELEFMDSSGVRVLVTAHAEAAERGRDFAVVRPAPTSPVAKILVIAGLDGQLTLLDDVGRRP
jgi:anti-anti-sigma factor